MYLNTGEGGFKLYLLYKNKFLMIAFVLFSLVTPVRPFPTGSGPKFSLSALKVPHRLPFQYPRPSLLRTTFLQQLCPQEATSPRANLPCLLYNTLFEGENISAGSPAAPVLTGRM